ncbi:pyridoxal-phosphate dependent enzyme [Rhizobium leguminosarum bv. viciae]|uniref:threonine ammonia-lyase n=1 Tax=Rhizobium leguminosarum TaxID=384 RepID=UPI00143F2286|nr:pyridoxal-phosphate dependent enzyme [Rhizobium leguminosarum]NKM65686.1 pyridoxal-phosphate dependent enzyme [Rhizobium leguminosarum bv. viciae]
MTEFDFSRIVDAHSRVSQHIVRTPLLNSAMLDEAAGCELFVKSESLQRTNSFKFRGALNMILQLPPEKLKIGVVAYSSGNHGQGVAAAGRLAGTPAVIVLPSNAAAVKVESCRWWGATEMCEQLIERGVKPDIVIAPCSGGGLAAGVVIAVHDYFPRAEFCVVEPQGYNKMGRSLLGGVRVENEHEARTVMDALIARAPGLRTFEILRKHAASGLSISDEESLAGVAAGFRYLKLVLEPAGAAALASVLAKKIDLRGKKVAIVCSGGNIDSETFCKALNQI